MHAAHFSRPTLTPILFILASLGGGHASAHDAACPTGLAWRDANYAQRTIEYGIDGGTVTVEVEGSPTMFRAQMDGGSGRTAIISMLTKAADGPIALTFGKNRPLPSQFAEISMAVEPPMVAGTWSRMKRPCDIKDGSTIAFNEKNMNADTSKFAAKPLKLRGQVRRKGLHFTYSVTASDAATLPGLSWHGELIYEASDRLAALGGDVQGWHVYRGDTFVRTIPLGAPVPLSSVLAEMGAPPL